MVIPFQSTFSLHILEWKASYWLLERSSSSRARESRPQPIPHLEASSRHEINARARVTFISHPANRSGASICWISLSAQPFSMRSRGSSVRVMCSPRLPTRLPISPKCATCSTGARLPWCVPAPPPRSRSSWRSHHEAARRWCRKAATRGSSAGRCRTPRATPSSCRSRGSTRCARSIPCRTP